MNKQLIYCVLATSLFALASAAGAQTTFSIGPQVGFNTSSASIEEKATQTAAYRTGFEAGVQSVVQFGHFALQPSVRFSQKGLQYSSRGNSYSSTTDYRLNYLTLPVDLAYCVRPNGQGLQVVAGLYVGRLVGGSYQSSSGYYYSPAFSTEGKIKAGDYTPVPPVGTTSSDKYFNPFDFGVQAGLGYRVGPLLAQAGFSFGLDSLNPTLPNASNRTAQVSLSYLFTPNRQPPAIAPAP